MVKIRRYSIDVNTAIQALVGLVMVFTMLSVANAEQLLKHPEKIQHLLEQKKITEKQIPNPHWHANGCISCHTDEVGSNNNLRTNNIVELCNHCHLTSESHSIIHPVNVTPGNKMLRRMPAELLEAIKKSSGKVDCLTCHDAVQACSEGRENVQTINPQFFRGGNYQDDRTRLCFYCHDKGQHERFNPHKQTAADGNIKKEPCYVCHKTMPDGEHVTNIGQLNFNVEDDYSSVEDDYSLMCNGCHPWKPHPGGSFSFKTSKVVDHLVVPSDKIMRQLQDSKIYLPLQPGTQRVFCGTCHNAHDKGVIKRAIAAQGAGSKNFLRDQNLCVHCHAK